MSRTLHAFTAYGDDTQGSRRWGASLVTSSVIYVGLAIAVAAVGGRNVARVAEKVIDVTFVEKVVTEPPPAPPAAVAPKVSAADVRPEMNVTPLVDVVLVLLIIFMVVAPRLEQDVQVDLPGVFNPDTEVKAVDPPKVTAAKAGEYYIDERPYGLDDARLPYGQMREIFARAQIQKVGSPGSRSWWASVTTRRRADRWG